ncbi:heterokaryon incompatibility protein-domain-containing protein [Clohesyomyces aquaticus]|uniref:Heterokaryon incompatibility protein-domain-containing protein n=1 Tax=Clohesyomyces aquaticus TaxID=1231657 RepID=A0A1Y1ZQM9_9PLEO|nr:heterokaryon incompatibility protein-domain-containing protein [Clohesyomyces aquaticus]
MRLLLHFRPNVQLPSSPHFFLNPLVQHKPQSFDLLVHTKVLLTLLQKPHAHRTWQRHDPLLMRLLQLDYAGKLSLVEYFGHNIPPYAILSHTWGANNEEVSFRDVTEGAGKNKAGYDKIRLCGTQATLDGMKHFWVDTCCIDKSSSAELSEAINSMYKWYKDSGICYAYLADVYDATKFTESRWFTRGWTLQELIAPKVVVFYDANWERIGTKDTLSVGLSERTGIPHRVLKGINGPSISVAQKLSWASNRETTRVEDMAYCLLGLFSVNMPLLYGEGWRAFNRLQEEILRQEKDHSLLAWRTWTPGSHFSLSDWNITVSQKTQLTKYPLVGILAQSPKDFANSGCIKPFHTPLDSIYEMTNVGLKISMATISFSSDSVNEGENFTFCIGLLRCAFEGHTFRNVGIPLVRTRDGIYHRLELSDPEFSTHELSTIPVPPSLAVRAVSSDIFITSTIAQKAVQGWRDWGWREHTIVLEISPELALTSIAWFDEFETEYNLENGNEMHLSVLPGGFYAGYYHYYHIIGILHSSALNSVLIVLAKLNYLPIRDEKSNANIRMKVLENANPLEWSESQMDSHCRHALDSLNDDSDLGCWSSSKNIGQFSATIEARVVVNQRIYQLHISKWTGGAD